MRLQVLNASDQDAPGDAVMNDAADESEMQEISTGAAMAVPMQQVCLLSTSCFVKFKFSKSCVFDPGQFGLGSKTQLFIIWDFPLL